VLSLSNTFQTPVINSDAIDDYSRLSLSVAFSGLRQRQHAQSQLAPLQGLPFPNTREWTIFDAVSEDESYGEDGDFIDRWATGYCRDIALPEND